MIEWPLVFSISWRFSVIVIVVAGTALGVWSECRRRQVIRRFARGGCSEAAWRSAFPEVETERIRKFLAIFAKAFDIGPKQAVKMRPEVRPMDLYKAIYSGWHTCDSLEFEFFAREVEKEYGVSWREIRWEVATLGEVFGKAIGISQRRVLRRWE